MTEERLVEKMAMALSTAAHNVDIYDQHRESVKAIWRAWATTALTAIRGAGLVIVPREPTREMQEASYLTIENALDTGITMRVLCSTKWCAMIEAGKIGEA